MECPKCKKDLGICMYKIRLYAMIVARKYLYHIMHVEGVVLHGEIIMVDLWMVV